MASDLKEMAAKRVRMAFDLQAAGLEMMRQNLRRRYPDATEAEITARLNEWLSNRPPDAPGRRVPWPRP
jgi:hypothetical protein